MITDYVLPNYKFPIREERRAIRQSFLIHSQVVVFLRCSKAFEENLPLNSAGQEGRISLHNIFNRVSIPCMNGGWVGEEAFAWKETCTGLPHMIPPSG